VTDHTNTSGKALADARGTDRRSAQISLHVDIPTTAQYEAILYGTGGAQVKRRAPRRTRGRLRPLTLADRVKRQARRVRNNPARVARLAAKRS
jgi:hypothetical protein